MIAQFGLLLALSTAPQCAPVEKDVITGADLAAIEPGFTPIRAMKTIGYAPAPGRQRIFGIAELKAIADANGLNFEPSQEICFAWPVGPIDNAAAETAMKAVFPDAVIEIVETSRFPAPTGAIEFPKSGLQRQPSPIMLWRGYVLYGTGRKFDVWARVRIALKQQRVTATSLLRAGAVIRDDQVRLDVVDGPPSNGRYTSSLEEVVGRIAKTTIVAGAFLKSTELDVMPEIRRGDWVNVEVLNGAARVSLEALASTTARLGEAVELQNQTSGKTFRARVSGMRQAVIVLGKAKE